MTDDEMIELDNEHIQHMQQYYKRRYEQGKDALPQKYQEMIEQSVTQRYLVIRGHLTEKSIFKLRNAYKLWCKAYRQPELIVAPACRYKTVQAQIDLAVEYDFECLPRTELDFSDTAIHHLLLLAHEYNWSSEHIHLSFVRWDHVDEVAQELLAFYDRMHQRMQEGQKP